jgi:hypothetical protein
LDVFSELAITRYEKTLQENNGILEYNQKNILLPIVVDPQTSDTHLMNTMNAYGKTRGAIAHKFAMIRTEHTLGDVAGTINLMLNSIASYDKAACASLSLAMSRSA